MNVWIIVSIRLLIYPIFFQIFLSFIKFIIGIINSIQYKYHEGQEPPHEIRLNINKWEQNSELPRDNIKKMLGFIGIYYALYFLIFQLISVFSGGISLGLFWNFIIMILSYFVFKIINPILVRIFSKYLPGFKQRWEKTHKKGGK